MSDIEQDGIEQGSGNVFADLGTPDPAGHQLKAQLVARMLEAMRDQGLTQTAAAGLMGITQPEVSRMSRGQFRDVTADRLLRLLTRLGCEVDIVVQPRGRAAFAPIHLDAGLAGQLAPA